MLPTSVRVCRGGADETSGAVVIVAADRCDRGETDQPLGRQRQHAQLARQRELCAECVESRVDLAGKEPGERKVALKDHPAERVVELARDRHRALDEVARVAVTPWRRAAYAADESS
jgi:hypothetical protein